MIYIMLYFIIYFYTQKKLLYQEGMGNGEWETSKLKFVCFFPVWRILKICSNAEGNGCCGAGVSHGPDWVSGHPKAQVEFRLPWILGCRGS